MGSVNVMAGGKAPKANVASAAKGAPPRARGAQRHFDPDMLKSGGFTSWLTDKVLRNPFWIMKLLRRWKPLLLVRGWGIITRYDDVAEALQNDSGVAVPFGEKIEALNDGPNFLLGMKDGADYQWLHKATVAAFPVSDNDKYVAPISLEEASNLIEQGRGRIDAISDLITLVPTRICERYYGVDVPDEFAFGQWTISMSSFMFGDPTDNPVLREMGAGGQVTGCARWSTPRLPALIRRQVPVKRVKRLPRGSWRCSAAERRA